MKTVLLLHPVDLSSLMSQIEVYHVFPDDLDPKNSTAILREKEAHHLIRVRRAKPGDAIVIINGEEKPGALLRIHSVIKKSPADSSTTSVTGMNRLLKFTWDWGY